MISVGFAFAASFRPFVFAQLLILCASAWLSNHLMPVSVKKATTAQQKWVKRARSRSRTHTFGKWIEIRKFIARQNTLINFITAMNISGLRCWFRVRAHSVRCAGSIGNEWKWGGFLKAIHSFYLIWFGEDVYNVVESHLAWALESDSIKVMEKANK